MNSNPFPASFLNFKGQFHLARVYIPGNQTFMVSQAACSLPCPAHAVKGAQDTQSLLQAPYKARCTCKIVLKTMGCPACRTGEWTF